ncbi:hypothetical protein MY10362_008376 [Beauveria mimosiformis]
MYTPMMTPSILGRGMLPYIPNSQPPSSRRKKASSDADGESLSPSTSKSSEASSDGEPSSPTCQHAPLKSVRPTQAAAVGPDINHYHHHHHQRRTQRRCKNQHHDEEAATLRSSGSSSIYSNINHINHTGRCTDTPAAASPSTGAVSSSHAKNTPPRWQHYNHHHQHAQKPCLSASSPHLPPASSPKHVAHHGALKRASHSFISRSKHNHHHNHDSHHPLTPDSKHAHVHVRHSSFWSPRSPAAAYMNGAASPSAHDISSRSAAASAMSSSVDTSSSSRENLLTSKPFVLRNGRAYLNDTSLPYPLPADLTELHRQSMRTLLLIQVFGGPVCSPVFSKRPPRRVLEIGCGSGFWSMMCHRYFKSRGHGNISFTGVDIAPLAPNTGNTTTAAAAGGSPAAASAAADAAKPDPEMNWHFLSHDLRQLPWPMDSEQFDLVMVKDMSLVITNFQHQHFVDEYIRLLRPGGVLEIWESDHLIRMLRPHVPEAHLDDAEDQEAAASLGAYVMNANTPLSAPLNTFLVEYNQWLSRALEARDLSAVPCTLIGPALLQESETLTDVRSRRLAIPLSEVRWEREGVGGVVVTKDGSSSSKDKDASAPPKAESRVLSPGQEALRQTALLTVVQQVQALEPILREVSGKSQDEWDVWMGKMMGDLMSDSGTSWGECLEVGAWSATKRS